MSIRERLEEKDKGKKIGRERTSNIKRVRVTCFQKYSSGLFPFLKKNKVKKESVTEKNCPDKNVRNFTKLTHFRLILRAVEGGLVSVGEIVAAAVTEKQLT